MSSSTERLDPSLRTRIRSGITSVALIACSAAAVLAPAMVVADVEEEARSDLMFDVMVGELAGRRGQLGLATDFYMRAAERSDDPRVAKRATQLAVWGNRWDDAEMVGNRWLSLAPESTEAHELLGQVYLQSSQINRATVSFSSLIEFSDDKKTAIEEIVLVLMRDADRARSLKIMSTLASQHPEEVELLVGQARMALSMGAREDALKSAEAALALEPKSGVALLLRAQALGAMGKPTEGFSDIRAALESNPQNTELRLGFAQLLVEAGRHSDATEELETLYQQSGTTNPELLLSIGLLALESKRSDAAVRYLESLLATEQLNDQAHFYLGRIRDEQQEYAQAIEHYVQVRADNLYLVSQLRSAELHATVGDLDKGRQRIQSLKNVVTNKELYPQIMTTEARMLQQAGELSEAIAVLSEGLEAFPDSGELLYSRALTADANNDPAMLRADLNRLIEVQPDNANAMNALGYHLADNNIELEKAAGLIERAFELNPNDAAIMDSMGWLRYRQGDNAAALEFLQKAYSLLPDPEIAAHLGEVLWVTGDQQGARTLWDKALLDAPEHAKLKKAIERFVQ